MKAHSSTYRVGSRLGQCPPYATVRNALVTMADHKRDYLRKTNIVNRWIVADNIQAYALRRDQRIGSANRMITGTGATAIDLEDCPLDAFNLRNLNEKIALQECKNLTTEVILNNIDWTHLELVTALHILDILVEYVPSLDLYKKEVQNLFKNDACKHQINPNRKSSVHPLGTNSANEVSTQGMFEAMVDFLEQTGMSEETLNNRIQFFSGDGKSFEVIGKVKKYLASQSGDFKSFSFIVEVLELWHTEWHDLGRICATYWGPTHSNDPSTLAYLAKTINSPTPSDFKKVDFFHNTRLVEVAVKAHVLQCWE